MNDLKSHVETSSNRKEYFSLSSKELSLLTHIVRTYNVDQAIQLIENTHSQKRKSVVLNSVQEYNKRSKLPLTINNSNQLSTNQWQLLSNITSTYDKYNAIPVVQHILSKQSSYQPKIRFKLKYTLNIINKFFLSLNYFLNGIYSHTIINKNLQKYIQNRNCFLLSCLNGLFIGRETYLLHNQAHAANFTILYNENLMLITNRLMCQLEQNPVLFKLLIVILSFSTNLSIVDYKKNSNEVTNINYQPLNQYENSLIDLFWKYMLYKYQYHECIYRFSTMIKIILDLIDQIYQTEELNKTR